MPAMRRAGPCRSANSKERGKPSSVAICAAAHKLARAVWVVLVRKDDFAADPKAA